MISVSMCRGAAAGGGVATKRDLKDQQHPVTLPVVDRWPLRTCVWINKKRFAMLNMAQLKPAHRGCLKSFNMSIDIKRTFIQYWVAICLKFKGCTVCCDEFKALKTLQNTEEIHSRPELMRTQRWISCFILKIVTKVEFIIHTDQHPRLRSLSFMNMTTKYVPVIWFLSSAERSSRLHLGYS